MSHHILVVDDDPHIRDLLVFALGKAGMTTEQAGDGEEAAARIAGRLPDLVVLDINMPRLDGLALCRRLRGGGGAAAALPILFLSSRDDAIDRIVGIEIGGDDYVVKPFSPREVVARVGAILKRGAPAAAAVPGTAIRHGRLALDGEGWEARIDDVPVATTATEYQLLALLASMPSRVFTRDAIIDRLRGPGFAVTDRTIDSHVRNLRAKFAGRDRRSDRDAVRGGLSDRRLRLIEALKGWAKRHWPALSLRTILLGTFVFVAALPGVGAVFLRVYENTLVQQTEAELIAQGVVLAAAYRADWGGGPRPARRPVPERPRIDLRVDPVLPPAPAPVRREGADPKAALVGQRLAGIVADASGVTLAATRLLDAQGVVVAGRADVGLNYGGLPEVRAALAGRTATVLRTRFDNPYGLRSPLEWLSRAVSIRVHHVRPVIVGGRVVGAVMLSRSPRGLFRGIYQDRGKIALGVALIFATLVVLAGLLSRGIARPIRVLAAASEGVARGRVAIPEPPATAAIEIRDLYANFAVMADRIEARGRYLRDFAAALSHEFKTPLTGIRGVLELLGEHDMDPAQRRHFLANATADADRLAHLVQRLLDLARADMATGGDARCDPVAVADQVAREAVGVGVSVTHPPEPARARIEGDALAAILATLIDNSRQAGAQAARITIAARGAGVAIRVEDDGPGIAPGDRTRIFEPFFTGRRAQGGTGLGLPIARSLLSATGGTIGLVDGEWACFEIVLGD